MAFTSILVNGFSIIPYYYSNVRKEKTASGINLKIMLANVEYRNECYDKLIKSVKLANPDILILQELTEKWRENIESLRVNYPYIVVEPHGRGSGLALLSLYPIESSKILNRGEPIRPSAFCKINLNGVILSILTIHPPTPMTRTKFANRNENFAQAAKIIKDAAEPKLLIGDLNTTMWSPYFSDLVKASGLRDVRIGKGLKTSWISFFPALFRIPIDHCLVGKSIEVETVEIGNSTGSDHLPLIVILKIEMSAY